MNKFNKINFPPPNLRRTGVLKKTKQFLDNNPKTKNTLAIILTGLLILSAIPMGNDTVENEKASATTEASTKPSSETETGQKKQVSEPSEVKVAPVVIEPAIAKYIYGPNYSNKALIDHTLERQVKFVASRPAFVPSLGVVKKYEGYIRDKAREKGVPAEVALGMVFLENGGSERATSTAGARGIFQLMPSTARGQGLVVNRYRDDRLNPLLNIKAGLNYLAGNYNTFRDWGFAIWSYHAGAGNVCKAIRIYAQANHNLGLGSCDTRMARYVDNANLTVNEVLQDRSVKIRLTNRLNDDTAGYIYKVMATSYLFDIDKNLGTNEFLKRTTLLNANRITVRELSRI